MQLEKRNEERMADIKISANGEALTVNGQSWSDAPLTEELCQAVGCHDLVDGGSVIIEEKPTAKFRYFEDLGIAILESIPGGRVWRVSIYLELPQRTRLRKSPYKSYGHEPQRSPGRKFGGQLIIDAKWKYLQKPLRNPMRGGSPLILPKGPNISIYVTLTSSEFVEYIGFEFKRDAG